MYIYMFSERESREKIVEIKFFLNLKGGGTVNLVVLTVTISMAYLSHHY